MNIDMEEIVFINGQQPAANDVNLNKMQKNIKNAINSIIESGSNDNGSYIKYADGTMICRATKETGIITWTADAVENVFLASGNFEDFPQKFIAAPDVVKGISYITPNSRYVDMCGQGAPSTTNAGSFNLKTYWNATNTNVRVSYIAIGKWK